MSNEGQSSEDAQEPRDAPFAQIATQVIGIAFPLVLALSCRR